MYSINSIQFWDHLIIFPPVSSLWKTSLTPARILLSDSQRLIKKCLPFFEIRMFHLNRKHKKHAEMLKVQTVLSYQPKLFLHNSDYDKCYVISELSKKWIFQLLIFFAYFSRFLAPVFGCSSDFVQVNIRKCWQHR